MPFRVAYSCVEDESGQVVVESREASSLYGKGYLSRPKLVLVGASTACGLALKFWHVTALFANAKFPELQSHLAD